MKETSMSTQKVSELWLTSQKAVDRMESKIKQTHEARRHTNKEKKYQNKPQIQ